MLVRERRPDAGTLLLANLMLGSGWGWAMRRQILRAETGPGTA